MAALVMARLETTTSVASSFEQLHPRTKEKMKQKSKESNDPLRVLDPARKKLSSVEAQRVAATLDDTIRRVEIVTLLPYITENLSRFSVLLGTDLVKMLDNHDRLQSAYQKAVAKFELDIRKSRSSSPSQSESVAGSSRRSSEVSAERLEQTNTELAGSRTSSVGRQSLASQNSGRVISAGSHQEDEMLDPRLVDTLQMQLAHSVRNVLRLFSHNPSAVNAIKNEKNERSFEANKMIDELAALRGILFERLLTTPSEEKERKQYLKQVVTRERKSSELASKLQAELENAVNDKENEISKRNDVIRKLKNDIFNVEKSSEEQNHRIIAEAARLEAGELKSSDGKKGKLQQEIIELKKTLESDTQAHRESELALRKRKYKIETEVENWIQKFDGDMGDRQDEFDALDAVYTEEKKQLQELEERFKTLEKEYLQIVEERRIAKEKAEAAQRELNIKIRAARLIQNLWRSHKARKLLKKKGKKKGKKGKKGKKSGGKKKKR